MYYVGTVFVLDWNCDEMFGRNLHCMETWLRAVMGWNTKPAHGCDRELFFLFFRLELLVSLDVEFVHRMLCLP